MKRIKKILVALLLMLVLGTGFAETALAIEEGVATKLKQLEKSEEFIQYWMD